MQIQIIEFELAGITPMEYEQHCEKLAAGVFSNLPGLLAKYWLSDPQNNRFGGVYFWRDEAALADYQDSPIYQGLMTNPAFWNVQSKVYSLLDMPTRYTARTLPVAS
ncbi:MAG: hypothetical protein OHK0021_08660 [Bryobacter sp.]